MNTNEHKSSAQEISVQEVSLNGVRFGYGERVAVEGVSLKINAGERVAIVGPNGCGKSTLLKLMVGSLRPQAGRILFNGREPGEIGRIEMARRVALVPQMAGGAGDGLWLGAGSGFTVREVVLMSRYAAHVQNSGPLGRLAAMGFETADDLQLANEAMWAMDVHHLAEREVETLSGGERQRVTIARALAQRTPVLLLDEPASALDLYHQLELMALLEEMGKRQKLVVMVTHDLNLAARHATRVVVMDQGRIVADGAPETVLTASVLEPVYRVKVISGTGGLGFERNAG